MTSSIIAYKNTRELRALPDEIHLFCPRRNDDDTARYDAREELDESSAELMAEATVRKQKFLSCLRILAYSDEGVAELQEWVVRKLNESLEKCDVCIKGYYMGKIWLTEKLKESYDDEDIDRFSHMLDEMDINRITRNLQVATSKLRSASSEDAGMGALDKKSLLSIFESMSCEAMLRNHALLQQYFDEPFTLLQARRSLKLSDYLPATTRFLFDATEHRNRWASQCWARYTRPPTTEEFDWAIKEPLLDALQTASQQPLQANLLQRLWRGMQLILHRLDKEQITHNLRALEIDPCRLSVDHLAIPVPALRFLLNSIYIFLEKVPSDFWDAMQTISPQAIMERIFYNPQFDAFLVQSASGPRYENSALKDALSWISPFMSSLGGPGRPAACRFLCSQLLGRLQDTRFPKLSRYHCFHIGLLVLLQTLRSFTDHESSRGTVERVVLSETLGVVSENIKRVLEPPLFGVDEVKQRVIGHLCMDVIRNTLALECQSLKSDYEVILRHGALQHGVSTYSPPIWDGVVTHLRSDNMALSTAALLGILPLVGLEKFPIKGEESYDKTHFNMIYGHLTHFSCQIFERLSDFRPEHLNPLFRSQDTCNALISALFSADLNTYEAAVDLIKNVSGQSARRDAMSHLLQSFFTSTLIGLSWSFRRISNMKTFASAPRMVLTGTDIIDILCDSQSGILRTRKLVDRKEVLSVQKFWEYLWQALATIFDTTESWNHRGNDKQLILDFCRDTIQFADHLFSQYNVFRSAIVGTDPSQIKAVSESFLKPPTATMSAMVNWLRLKDEYLASTLVGLVGKLLRRLGELSVTTVKQDALTFIENVALRDTIRTILTRPQKAELARAREAYYKRPVFAPSVPKKQSVITDFVRPADRTAELSVVKKEKEESPSSISEDMMELSRSVELNKVRIAARKPSRPSLLVSKSQPVPALTKPKAEVQLFREKREKEKEAKRQRDQAELARLKRTTSGVVEQTGEQGSGKDQPTDSMMVSSSSESDWDEEDDLDRFLFGEKPSRSSTKPAVVREYEESKRMSLKKGPIRKVKQIRSAKDMRARLAPDLSTLHHTLLSWDFFATGDLPPTSSQKDYTLVSNTFRDPVEYQKTFEPLLILEAWQGFVSAREDNSFKTFEVKVATRMSVDSFVEISTVGSVPAIKEYGLSDADLVLLSKSKSATTDASAAHCLARISGISKKKSNIEVSYRLNPGNPLLSYLTPGASVWGARISSLTPLEREYGALMALQYYDLCEEIIKARPSPILDYSDASLRGIVDNYKLNHAQSKAIKSALDNDAFTLIQGPPGSGKTKTIVALIGALLSDALRNHGGVDTSCRFGGNNNNQRAGVASKKLLICAPSNAAVDELVMRLKEGIKTLQGQREKPSVIRLGRTDAINANVLDVTLDQLVNARLDATAHKESGDRDLQKIYGEHKSADTAFKEVRFKLDQLRTQGSLIPTDLEREFDVLKKKRSELSRQIDATRDKKHVAARDADLARRRIQQEVINGANIICATLSGSGHEMFQNLSVEFETVVIDEAAQSIELSALIPLKYGCSKCILVGDPKQLPPAVLSKVASRFQFEQSLFVRMQMNHPRDVHLLDIQYRMHPEISKFPCTAFYDGRLQDGPNMGLLRARPWHNGHLLGPFRFFDVKGLHQPAAGGHSLVNMAEIQVAMQIYERLTVDFSSYDFAGKIGIITPYKGQLKELKSQFVGRFGESIFGVVDFNTTDAFQGRESEVIIFSCVRATNKGIGFLADIRRMNVGLTRAMSSLWVLGNSQSLVQGEFWKKLIVNSRERNLFTDGDVLSALQRPQFVGYNDVEMAGADDDDKDVGMSHDDGEDEGLKMSDFDDDNSVNGDRASPEPVSVSARGTPPMGLPEGPSGGSNGLNDNKICGICGSNQHYTHNCNNVDAKEDARGLCLRCRKPGHTRPNCNEPRCMQCGQLGHVDRDCTSSERLSKAGRVQVRREEDNLLQLKKQKADRLRQKHLARHDPQVPVVKASPVSAVSRLPKGAPFPSTAAKKKNGNQSAKFGPHTRKRPSLPDQLTGANATRPRTSEPLQPPSPQSARRPSYGRQKLDVNVPPAAPPTDVSQYARSIISCRLFANNVEQLVVPSRKEPAYSSLPGQGSNNNNKNNNNSSSDGFSAPTQPRAHAQPFAARDPGIRRPPVVRRNTAADPFIRPKKRR